MVCGLGFKFTIYELFLQPSLNSNTMTVEDIIQEIKSYGNEGTRRVLMNHGAKDPCFGVKIEDLKKVLKKTKVNTALALELFNTGIYDAMYLAGLMANGAEMTPVQIEKWASVNYGGGISEYTIPWVTTEHPAGMELALKWIDSKEEVVAVTGWATISNILSVRANDQLDFELLKKLLKRVETSIHEAPNRVRYWMNNFIIALGSYVPEFNADAISAASMIGKVTVIMDGTACKVPDAKAYIHKVMDKGYVGRKRKEVKC